MKIHSLRVRMMIAVTLLAVSAVVAVALAARQRTRVEFQRFQELERAVSLKPDNEVRIAKSLTQKCCEPEEIAAAAATLPIDYVLVLIDAEGQVVAKAGKPLEGVEDFRFSHNGNEVGVETSQSIHGGGAGMRLLVQTPGIPVTKDSGTLTLYVFPWPKGAVKKPETLFLSSLDHSLLLATSLVAIVVLIATWTLTARIVQPVESLGSAVRELTNGNFTQRVAVQGSDEIAALSRNFNMMASQLEAQQTLRQNLVHDVVHELRTPLTALRCRLDSIVDGVAADSGTELERANEEIDHLTRLIGDLHEVALAEAGELRLSISTSTLAPIVASATRAAGLSGDTRIKTDVDETLTIKADAVRLRQVLLNLLSNAARHTPSHGTIVVSACTREETVTVEVRNTGSQLAEPDLAHVFDRFYRVDSSRVRSAGGSGLGLAIVKNLVEAQGGRVWGLSDANGVSFGFTLPSH